MRVLTPKFAFATLIFVFAIYLAMSGRLNQMIDFARKSYD